MNKFESMNKFEYVDISFISAKDIIEHNNEMKTVTKTNIGYIQGLGKTLFGDCYRLGYKKVKRFILPLKF